MPKKPRKTRSDKGKKRTKPYNKGKKRKRVGRTKVKAHSRGGPLALGSLFAKNESLFGTDSKDPWKVKKKK